jgi:uncharacterized protein YkwD
MGRGIKRITIICMLSVLGSVLVPATASSSSADNACWEYTTAEKRFKRTSNNERLADLLGKVQLDPELSKAARKHTKEMLQADKGLFHTTSEQFHKRITNWNLIGENVGYGGGVDSLHEAFMDSPPHAHNVLTAAFVYVGIGARRDSDGTMWVTIIFEATENPGTTLPMPSCG